MLQAEAVAHRYTDAPVLRAVDLAVGPGELHVVCGPSGSGKSTLLFLLGGLLRPTSGAIRFYGLDLGGASSRARRRLLTHDVRVCLQQHRLTPYLTAGDSVRLGGAAEPRPLLEEFGVGPLAQRLPARLSAGEQQRVALAQALACGPRLLLADEPTSGLDPDTRDAVYHALRGRCDRGMAAVVSSHDAAVTRFADRVYRLQDGELRDVA